jgi:hypothetical protein
MSVRCVNPEKFVTESYVLYYEEDIQYDVDI